MTDQPTLVFAYRAEKGIFNTISHTMHRVFSPATYECRLCQFTFSAIGMLRPWKEFLESRPEAKLFYHRKEFEEDFANIAAELPLILKMEPDDSAPEILLDRAGIESCNDILDLIDKLEHLLGTVDSVPKPACSSENIGSTIK